MVPTETSPARPVFINTGHAKLYFKRLLLLIYEAAALVIPILQMRKLRPRELVTHPRKSHEFRLLAS